MFGRSRLPSGTVLENTTEIAGRTKVSPGSRDLLCERLTTSEDLMHGAGNALDGRPQSP